MNLSTRQFIGIALLVLMSVPGCADKAEPVAGNNGGVPPAGDEHTEQDHPSEGPHHGPLIELGTEEYHAEFVHDEKSQTLTIYMLDGSAKNAVPIDATEIVINIKHDGMGEQFKLSAAPLEEEAEGSSSRFASESKELGELLDQESAEASLVVIVNGKSYRGQIPHAHNHGHEH